VTVTDGDPAPAAPETGTRSPALELRGVSSGYGDTTILRNVSLTVPASGVVALLGPNGAGKTTLLNTVSGFLRPSAGSIWMSGEDVTQVPPDRRARSGLCHIPEGRGIFRSLTVRENLIMQSPKGKEQASIERAASVFPILGERLAQQAGTLSGGQQQMLAVAAAYTRDPHVILVDEASLGLAPIVVDEIFTFLEDVSKQDVALLIVDQYVTRALSMAVSAYVLSRGEIVFAGTSAELRGSDVFSRYLGNV